MKSSSLKRRVSSRTFSRTRAREIGARAISARDPQNARLTEDPEVLLFSINSGQVDGPDLLIESKWVGETQRAFLGKFLIYFQIFLSVRLTNLLAFSLFYTSLLFYTCSTSLLFYTSTSLLFYFSTS